MKKIIILIIFFAQAAMAADDIYCFVPPQPTSTAAETAELVCGAALTIAGLITVIGNKGNCETISGITTLAVGASYTGFILFAWQ